MKYIKKNGEKRETVSICVDPQIAQDLRILAARQFKSVAGLMREFAFRILEENNMLKNTK